MTTRLRTIALERLSPMDALDLAVLIEEEAEERYNELADQMALHHTEEAARFFRFMASNEKKHGAELSVRRRALFGDAPRAVRRAMLFDVEAPEYDEAHAYMSPEEALAVAMRCEQKAYAFFDAALPHVADPEVRALFEELRQEELHHQERITREMARLPEGDRLPGDAFEDEPVAM